MACRVDFPSRRADFEGAPCHSGNLDLQDHIVGACELEGASAHAFPSQKTQSFAQRPRNPFPFGQIALFANPLNEFSRILPAELPVPSLTKSMEIWSLIMLAVTAGTFLLVAWVAAKGPFFLPPGAASPLSADSLTDRAFSPR